MLQSWDVEFERCGYLWGREGLTKDATELHYGYCRIQCFLVHDPHYGVKVRISLPLLIFAILFHLLWVPQLKESAMCWSAPLRHIILWKHTHTVLFSGYSSHRHVVTFETPLAVDLTVLFCCPCALSVQSKGSGSARLFSPYAQVFIATEPRAGFYTLLWAHKQTHKLVSLYVWELLEPFTQFML